MRAAAKVYLVNKDGTRGQEFGEVGDYPPLEIIQALTSKRNHRSGNNHPSRGMPFTPFKTGLVVTA